MMHYSLVLNFKVKKQTWKEERKSEEKQTQTTREKKKKKWFFFFKFTLTTEFGSSSLALDLLSNAEQT